MEIALIVIGVVILLIVIISLRPGEFSVARSITVNAPPSAVFNLVNDLRQWPGWSPWAKLDPNMKTNYEGPSAGVGASYTWSGNAQVGQGRMTITESRPSDLVRIKLEMQKPMQATHFPEFTFKGTGAQTVVNWSMTCRNSFMAKAVGLFMNFEKMCGTQFEQGLAGLKSLAEPASKS